MVQYTIDIALDEKPNEESECFASQYRQQIRNIEARKRKEWYMHRKTNTNENEMKCSIH